MYTYLSINLTWLWPGTLWACSKYVPLVCDSCSRAIYCRDTRSRFFFLCSTPYCFSFDIVIPCCSRAFVIYTVGPSRIVASLLFFFCLQCHCICRRRLNWIYYILHILFDVVIGFLTVVVIILLRFAHISHFIRFSSSSILVGLYVRTLRCCCF